MKLSLAAALITVLAPGWAAAEDPAPRQDLQGDLLITDVTIVAPDAAPTGPADVRVRDGRITEVGPAIPRDDSPADLVVDGRGRFLTPGLIDGHTHLDSVPGMTFENEQAHPEIAAAARRQIPRSYLFYGFTTVVDLNSGPDAIAGWNGQEVRPQAYFCGGAPIADGYPMRFLPKPLRYRVVPYFIADDSVLDQLPDDVDPADHTPRAVVARMKADGAVCVKTHYESGFGGHGEWKTPSVEIIRDLVAAAHENDLPVLLHANSQAAQAFGLEAGVDAFAHGMWTWEDRTATSLNPDVTRILATAIERGVRWQPTIQVLYGERDLHDPGYLAQGALRDAVPGSLIEWYATEEGQAAGERMKESPWVAETLSKGHWEELNAGAIARVTAALSYVASHGGVLVFGSDTPSDLTWANPPGLNGRLEMTRWQRAGVTPSQLLRAATAGAAELYGLEDEIGTVEVGKRADLLLLAEDPTMSIAAFDSIETVILGGRAITRQELSARNPR